MNQTQTRSSPTRIYEPNIIHNPLTWFGIFTPQGWRIHRKRFGRAQPLSITLSGDGKTTLFPGALRDPSSAQVQRQDDLHLQAVLGGDLRHRHDGRVGVPLSVLL